MKKSISAVFSILAVMFFNASIAVAGQASGMNWKSGKISAIGIGVPSSRAKSPAQASAMACRAAKVDALRNLLETTKGVRIDSQTKVKDAMVESDYISTTVSGIVKGARVSKQQRMSDGSCEVTAIMPVAGALFSALISEERFRKEAGESKVSLLSFPERMSQLMHRFLNAGLVAEANASAIPVLTLKSEDQVELAKKLQEILVAKGDKVALTILAGAISDYQQSIDFTGIVIDASSVASFQPAALPWLRGSDGTKLYPNADTPYEVIKSSLPVSYDFSVNNAVKRERVASKPLIVKAVST